MMKNYLSLTCILATWAAAAAVVSGPSSQPPAVADCSTLIYNMMDCISFLSSGGDKRTPDSACCSGFESVLNTDADCICYALSSAGSLGLDINMTKAEGLPSQCGVSAPPIRNCHVSTSPSASPANPPSSMASPSNSPSLPPTTPPGAAIPTPAEAPEAPSPAQSPESSSPAEAPEARSSAGGVPPSEPTEPQSPVPPSPAESPESSSLVEAPEARSSGGGVPPSGATEPTPASSGDYTISSAFSAFLIAIASNFLLFHA